MLVLFSPDYVMPEQVAPSVALDSFNCPHCGVYAYQHFGYGAAAGLGQPSGNHRAHIANTMTGRLRLYGETYEHAKGLSGVFVSTCFACKRSALWLGREVIYPAGSNAPQAVADMPSEVREIYDEARAVRTHSRRAAAALLRLAADRLCRHIWDLHNQEDDPPLSDNTSLNDLIAKLYAKELIGKRLREAADTLRVNGAGALHPGLIFEEDAENVDRLFVLINRMVERAITEDREIAEAFDDSVPKAQQNAIEDRDAKAKSRAVREGDMAGKTTDQ